MDSSAITIEILKNIRDEIHGVRGGLQEVRDEIRDTNQRIGSLDRRHLESDIRLSTEVVALAGVVREMRDALRDDRVSRVRVDDLEMRVTALEKRQA